MVKPKLHWEAYHYYARRAAFTLVELLVVIVIIGILAGLLLPALNRAKQEAQSVVCRNDLHQIGIALNLYTLDTGYYPPIGYPSTSRVMIWWNDSLQPYTSSAWLDPLYRCPRYPKWPMANTLGTLEGQFPQAPVGSYGYNALGWCDQYVDKPFLGLSDAASLLETSASLRPETVVAPSEMLAVGDAAISATPNNAMSGGGPWGKFAPLAFVEMASAAGPAWDSINAADQARHRQTYNVVLCDAHVENVPRKLLLGTNTISMQRWNYDNQAHEEATEAFPTESFVRLTQ